MRQRRGEHHETRGRALHGPLQVETATGPKRKAVYVKTRKVVSDKLTAAVADAWKGVTADGGRKTVGAFLTSWLEDSVRESVRKSTELPRVLYAEGNPYQSDEPA